MVVAVVRTIEKSMEMVVAAVVAAVVMAVAVTAMVTLIADIIITARLMQQGTLPPSLSLSVYLSSQGLKRRWRAIIYLHRFRCPPAHTDRTVRVGLWINCRVFSVSWMAGAMAATRRWSVNGRTMMFLYILIMHKQTHMRRRLVLGCR